MSFSKKASPLLGTVYLRTLYGIMPREVGGFSARMAAVPNWPTMRCLAWKAGFCSSAAALPAASFLRLYRTREEHHAHLQSFPKARVPIKR